MQAQIIVKATNEVIFESDREHCKEVMKPAFFKHCDEGKPMNEFPLQIIDIPEPSNT